MNLNSLMGYNMAILISIIIVRDTVDGRNPASPKGWLKPYKSWDAYYRFQLVQDFAAIHRMEILDFHGIFHVSMSVSEGYPETMKNLTADGKPLTPRRETTLDRAHSKLVPLLVLWCSSTKRAKSPGHS